MGGYSEALEHINSISRNGGKPGVICTRALLDRLGNPEAGLKVVHVAGTNGKGSVCAYMTGMLRSLGLSVGTFTSPHLVRENERISVDGADISDEDFASCFARVHEAELELLREGFGQITYFDFFMGIAVLYFARRNVDVVVLETGLGGRLDSTNVFASPLVTIITSISLDHTAILGDTIEKIASEKAGIIKPCVPVVYLKGREYSHILEERAESLGCVTCGVDNSQWDFELKECKYIDFSIHNQYYKKDVFRLGTTAVYQVENACLALMGIWCVRNALACDTPNGRDGTESVKPDAAWLGMIRKGLLGTSWKGRMQEVRPGIYVDGAHNPDGIRQFLNTVSLMETESTGGQKPGLVFAAVSDKNYDEMCAEVCASDLFGTVVITQVGGERRLATGELEKGFTSHGVSVDAGFGISADAFEYALDEMRQSGRRWFFAGSLYLAGEVLGYAGDAANSSDTKRLRNGD